MANKFISTTILITLILLNHENQIEGNLQLEPPKIELRNAVEYLTDGSGKFEDRGPPKYFDENNNSIAILNDWALDLICTAHYPIRWETNGHQGKRLTSVRMQFRYSDDKNYSDKSKSTFSSRLFYPLEAGNTGPVRCVSNDNQTLSKEIHLFVADPKSKVEFLNSNAHVNNLDPNIIPCSVYDPRQMVSLWKNVVEITGEAQYDPKIGFLLNKNTNLQNGAENFQCRTKTSMFNFTRFDTVLKSEPEDSNISAFENEEIKLSCECNKQVVIPTNGNNITILKTTETGKGINVIVKGKPGSYTFGCNCGELSKTWDLKIYEAAKLFIGNVFRDIRCSASDYSNAQLSALSCQFENTCYINRKCLENGKCKLFINGSLTEVGDVLTIGKTPRSGYVQCTVNGAKIMTQIFTGLNGIKYFNTTSAEKARAIAQMDEVPSKVYTDQEVFFFCESIEYLFLTPFRVLLTYLDGSTKSLIEGEDYRVDESDEFWDSKSRPGVNPFGFYINLTSNVIKVSCLQPWVTSLDWYETSRSVTVLEPIKAKIINSERNIGFIRNQKSQLTCTVEGEPTPNVTWESANNATKLNQTTAVKNYTVYQTLTFTSVNMENEGEYTCIASNRLGKDKRTFTVKVEESRSLTRTQLYGILCGSAIAFSILLALIFILWRKYSVTKKLLRDLTEDELDQFIKGSPDLIKDFVHAHEKAEHMPYDYKYEIPIKDLQFDKDDILGSGAFGIVVKGLYKKIPVAIKMTKPNADVSYFKALLSELKIMIYIEKHPNVVTFMGSFTENIKNRVLYIIVELCSGGNLESRLRKFKNELQCVETSQNNQGDLYGNSVQSEIKRILSLVLSWPRQIADGMEYLASKKVIHGDLAARNILLSADEVAKITDFGLSRQLYQYSNYTKKSQAPLPWRWMAVESLTELVFSTQSDIWSYGVLLWEIYSLGDVPFPSQAWTPEYTEMIQSGTRLKKPKFASEELYQVMCKCWSNIPEKRPSFMEISNIFQRIAAENK